MAQVKKIQWQTESLVGFLGWLVPGAGHWYLGQRVRGVVICVSICVTFLLGVMLGGVEMIDPQNATAWFCAQLLSGLPGLIGTLAQNPDIPMGYGRGVDLGQVYAGVAGLLNLFCVMDILMRHAEPEKAKLKKD